MHEVPEGAAAALGGEFAKQTRLVSRRQSLSWWAGSQGTVLVCLGEDPQTPLGALVCSRLSAQLA